MTLKEALQEAIREYNLWAAERAGGYDSVAAYGELRGIFFNKLLGRIKEVAGYQFHGRSYYGRLIQPTDFLCELSRSCALIHMHINPPSSSYSTLRINMLKDLITAATEVEYEILPTPTEYGLAGIVNAIKAYKV
jgi:hypothetical protein